LKGRSSDPFAPSPRPTIRMAAADTCGIGAGAGWRQRPDAAPRGHRVGQRPATRWSARERCREEEK
jgi:hypothetical protein